MLGKIAVIAGCFLVGGIPFGLLIARAHGIPDIRKYGSGNIGASNVLRTVGVKAGLLVWGIDVVKGLLPTLAAGQVVGPHNWWHSGAAFATIAGHCFSPYLGLKGGRGVASSLGVLLALDWRVGLLSLGVWIVLTFIWRYISLSSVVATLSAALWYRLFHGTSNIELFTCVVVVALLVTARHAPNIRRLMNGTETKIGQKAKELEQHPGNEQRAED